MSISFSTITQKARAQPIVATNHAMRAALAKLPPTNVSKLANGVRIACEENPLAQFATVGLWMETGTKYEERHTQGLSKVLQQCGLEGTASMDKSQLSKAIEEIGGHLMVDTGREHSYVAVKVAKENVGKAVGLLADITRNARLSDADVLAAKKKVDTVRQDTEECIDDLVLDNLHICAYDATENGGLGLSIKGEEAGINGLTVDQLQQYRRTHYTGPRALLVGTGGVSQSEMAKLAQEYLGDMSSEDNKPAVRSRYVGGDFRLWNLRMKTAHIAWAFETSGAVSGDTVPLQLATQVHGKFHRSQHEMGQHAIYRTMKTFSSLDHGTPTNTPFPEQAPEIFSPFHHVYEDTGLCGSYIVGRPHKTGPGAATSMMDMFNYTVSDWARLAQKGLHQQELDQAKVNMKAQLLYNMDGSTNSAKDIATQVFHYGRRVPLEEMYARIDDVTPGNQQEVLQHYFTGRRPVVSMTGYINTIYHYDTLCHWMYKPWY